MKVRETELKDCFIIEPRVFKDERGYFFESFNKEDFERETGLKVDFIQDNESFSSKGVLRGLHFQKGENAQAKLIRVIQGEIVDVIVDLRPDSNTFLKHITINLSSDNKKQAFIPRYFAHGFIVLSETAIINYKCDNGYNKDSERGIIYNDPDLGIDWKLNQKDFILSEKDLVLPQVKDIIDSL